MNIILWCVYKYQTVPIPLKSKLLSESLLFPIVKSITYKICLLFYMSVIINGSFPEIPYSVIER